MANQILALGTTADDGTGDNLRVGGDKINDNFLELYTALGDGDAIASGISASATVISLVDPNISGTVAGTQTAATITTLATTTVNGTTLNGGTLALAAGSITDSSGAISFGNENLTTTGTLGVGAITTTGAFKGADGYTIGNASVADVMTLASTGIVTFKDDIVLKDAATIGVASSTSAITIASTGIVTFVDDILIKDGGTIGAASATTAITIASSGIVTFVDDIVIKDGGTIGTSTDADAITIAAAGAVTFSQKDVHDVGVSVKNGSSSAGFIEFFENSGNGTNKVTLIGPASTGDVTLTLGSAAGTIATTADIAGEATALAIALG